MLEFPKSEYDIVKWAIELNKMLPDLNLVHLERLMDRFVLGKDDWNKNIGIVNFFEGLKRVGKLLNSVTYY